MSITAKQLNLESLRHMSVLLQVQHKGEKKGQDQGCYGFIF